MEEGSRIERREEGRGGEEEELSPFMVKTVFALKVSLQARPLRLFSPLREISLEGESCWKSLRRRREESGSSQRGEREPIERTSGRADGVSDERRDSGREEKWLRRLSVQRSGVQFSKKERGRERKEEGENGPERDR